MLASPWTVGRGTVRLLVVWARISIGIAAIVLVLALIIAGGGMTNAAGYGPWLGAVLGGLGGLLVAGTFLGLAAAIVDMHFQARTMVGLLKEMKEQNAQLVTLLRASADRKPISPQAADQPVQAQRTAFRELKVGAAKPLKVRVGA